MPRENARCQGRYLVLTGKQTRFKREVFSQELDSRAEMPQR